MGQMAQGQPQFDQRQQVQQPVQQRFLQDQSQFNAGQANGLQGVLAQQQSMHNTPNFFERPSSTSSATHSHQFSRQSPQAQQFPQQQNSQFHMMPPPPPRPPSSRPGTSQSQITHHSAAVVAPSSPALGNVGQIGGMQRPPSRPRTSSGFNMFGQGQPIGTPKPPTPIQPSLPLQQQQQQQQQPQASTPTHAVSPFLQQQLQLQSQQQPNPQQHQHQQPPVQTLQGFPQVPGTPIPGSPGRKRRLTGQGLDQPSPQFGGIGGSGSTGIAMNNPGNVGAGGLMSVPQAMGSPNPTLLGGAGGGMMGPPHVVPSRANSLGGQVPQLSQGLEDPGLFSQQLAASQTPLPSQVPQTPMAGGATPFQTSSGVPNIGMGGAVMRQRQAVLGTPGFTDVQAPLQSPVGQRMPQTVVTPAQMQMQMHSADALSINTGLPEVPSVPVVSDTTGPVPISHPPTAPASATPSATALPTLPSTAPSSAPVGNKTMRVTLVPPADIKPLTEEEVEEAKGWMARDKEYEAVYRSMKERMAEELRASRAENSDMWWEVSDGKNLRTKFSITYPGQRLRDNRKRGRREGFRL